MKGFFYSLVFLLLLQSFAHAQNREIDSLQKLLQTEKDETGRANLYILLSDAFCKSKPDTALLLAQQGLSLAKKSGVVYDEIRCLNDIGNAFRIIGKYPRALGFFLEALKKAESINEEVAIAAILGNIGTVYAMLADYRQSLDYFLKALVLHKRLNSPENIAIESLNIGDVYEKLNILDSGNYYTNLGYTVARHIKNGGLTGTALNDFGNIYSKMGRDAEALNNYRSGIPYLRESGDDDNFCETYLGMATLFRKTGKADSSLYYAKLSLSIAQTAGFTQRLMDACNFLANYYASLHLFDSAFTYQSAAIVAKDSLFSQEKSRELLGLAFDERTRQEEIAEAKEQAHTQLKFNALIGGLATFLIVALLLYRNNRQQRKAKVKIEMAYDDLKATQTQLIQKEKMASLGELTAGIAHEIQNPLNFINNFSEVNKELIDEMKAELQSGNVMDAISISNNIGENENKILLHGKRADGIVKGMLLHSRVGAGEKVLTDINAVIEECLKLSYHNIRAKEKSFDVQINTDFDKSIAKFQFVPQDMVRVFVNLFNNAFYAVTERKRIETNGYTPSVSVSTAKAGEFVTITIKDNGIGIPQKIIDKIFQPFFTTKPTGQGTGLGLSLSYDIVKAHGGEINVNTEEGEFTEFVIQFPVN
ncbi:MAG TPA: ATP-binding protein [Puia sp.]|nr:ATP-binding protein [Puia sp.]